MVRLRKDKYQGAIVSTMRLGVILAVVASLLATGVAGAHSGPTVVTGTVLLDPATPVCRVGVPCTKPLSGFKLTFWRNGAVAARAKTNAHGRYRVTLEPGAYRVTHPHGALGKGLTPKRISVPPAPTATRNFRYDAGIR